MRRRAFIQAVLGTAASAAMPAGMLPAFAGITPVLVGPYYYTPALDMDIVFFKDSGIYYLRTLQKRDEGQIFRGPYPAVEWDGPYPDDWIRQAFVPDVNNQRTER